VYLLIISSSYAQNQGDDARELYKENPGFFDSDSARTSFQPEPENLAGPEFGVFNANLKRESLKEKLKREEEEERKKEEALLAAKMGAVPQQDQSELASKDDVLKKFGDPKEEPEVLATKDAPKPFQGMMAALHLGDETLAKEYARQYARYMKTTRERVVRTSNLASLAMATDGAIDESSQAWSIASEAEKNLFKEDIEALKSVDAVSKHELSDKAKELLKLATEEEDNPKTIYPVQEAENKGFLGSKEEQIAFARRQHGKTPLKDSEIDVFVFVNTKQEESLFAAGYIERVFQNIKSNDKVRFAALSFGLDSEPDRELFRTRSQISYPIISGNDLARDLKIQRAPSIVFVAKNSGKAVIEVGRRGDHYLLERLRLMLGGVK